MLETPYCDTIESISALLAYKGTPFTFTEFYRPPNTNDPDFAMQLDVLLNISKKENAKLNLVASDQNYDLLKSSIHSPTRDFVTKMYS